MKVKFGQDEAERQKQMEAETRRRKAMELEYSRVEKQLNHLLPLVNEANLASTELKRNLIRLEVVENSLVKLRF